MSKKEIVIQKIMNAIDELNQQLPDDEQVEKSLDTVLQGKSAKLDSLGLTNLIVTTEQKIEEEFGIPISLTDVAMASSDGNPFATIDTLADCICALLD